MKEQDQMDAESFVAVVQTAAEEQRKEVVVEERNIIEEAPRPLQEIQQQPVRERDDNWFVQQVKERDDDWFVLLDVVPRQTSYVPPGTSKILCAIFQNNFGFFLTLTLVLTTFSSSISHTEGTIPDGG